MFHEPGVFILGLDTIFTVTVAVNIIVIVVVIVINYLILRVRSLRENLKLRPCQYGRPRFN